MRLLVPAAVAAVIATTAMSLAALPVSTLPVSTLSVSTLPVSTLPVVAVRRAAMLGITGSDSRFVRAGPSAGPSPARADPAAGSGPALADPGHGAGARASAVPPGRPPGRGFSWPLAPRPAVHRRFEPPRDRYSRGHRGVDLLSGAGQPVLSAGEGVVAFSGVIAGRGVVTVRHSGALRTSYEPVDGRVPTGTRVHRGTPIGVLSPAPGHCIPLTCLHWGAISGVAYLDPLSLLGLGRPILLPLG